MNSFFFFFVRTLKTLKMALIWRISNGIMTLFFALATYVQHNDEYALCWMLIYFIPCIITSMIMFDVQFSQTIQMRRVIYFLLSIYIIISIGLSVQAAKIIANDKNENFNLLQHQEMKEFLGVLIIKCWLLICVYVTNIHHPLDPLMTNVCKISIILLSLFPISLWIYHGCFGTDNHKVKKNYILNQNKNTSQWRHLSPIPFNRTMKTITIAPLN